MYASLLCAGAHFHAYKSEYILHQMKAEIIYFVSRGYKYMHYYEKFTNSPCNFSPLAEIPGSIELLENSLTSEGVQWRKIIQ